jgi:AraC-like DNA-binding protein
MTYYWLVFFITITILIGASVFVTLYYLTFTNKPGEIMDTLPSHLLSGMASFLLIICLLAFPNILYGMPKFGAQNIKEKTGGTNDPLLELGENIIKYIHSEQRYLDNNFHIKDLSIALNVPQHHVLYCFNHLIKQSFNEYCTQCRIHWAKELIDKGIITSLTIEAIGVKLGFPSRSKFYLAFEKETGYTPNQYLELTSKKT